LVSVVSAATCGPVNSTKRIHFNNKSFIITNGQLLICELKCSIDKAGMYSFERKARFYERRHERQADRLLVISPMIDARAQKVAARLGIETYGDSTEVEAI
jgi:hypothetical protein